MHTSVLIQENHFSLPLKIKSFISFKKREYQIQSVRKHVSCSGLN